MMRMLGMAILAVFTIPFVWIVLANAGWWAFFAGLGLTITTLAVAAGFVGAVSLTAQREGLYDWAMQRLGRSGPVARR